MNPDAGRVLVEALSEPDAEAARLYDQTLVVTTERVALAKCLSKADIGSLVLWKRISAQTKWARQLQAVDDIAVMKITGEAFHLANDTGYSIPEAGLSARLALRELPGMGPALASAVLVACAPDRMAVWDRRVKAALGHPAIDCSIPSKAWTYGEYLRVICELADAMSAERPKQGFTPRQVDLVLFHLGG